jgi:hypothetical protein
MENLHMAMELVDFFTSMLLLLVVHICVLYIYIYIYNTHIWSTYDMYCIVESKFEP